MSLLGEARFSFGCGHVQSCPFYSIFPVAFFLVSWKTSLALAVCFFSCRNRPKDITSRVAKAPRDNCGELFHSVPRWRRNEHEIHACFDGVYSPPMTEHHILKTQNYGHTPKIRQTSQTLGAIKSVLQSNDSRIIWQDPVSRSRTARVLVLMAQWRNHLRIFRRNVTRLSLFTSRLSFARTVERRFALYAIV